MRHLSTLVLFLVLNTNLFAQNWEITEVATLPEAVSNNAVIEGFVNGVPYIYSFLVSTTTYSVYL